MLWQRCHCKHTRNKQAIHIFSVVSGDTSVHPSLIMAPTPTPTAFAWTTSTLSHQTLGQQRRDVSHSWIVCAAFQVVAFVCLRRMRRGDSFHIFNFKFALIRFTWYIVVFFFKRKQQKTWISEWGQTYRGQMFDQLFPVSHTVIVLWFTHVYDLF